jgi:hypothetical protein
MTSKKQLSCICMQPARLLVNSLPQGEAGSTLWGSSAGLYHYFFLYLPTLVSLSCTSFHYSFVVAHLYISLSSLHIFSFIRLLCKVAAYDLMILLVSEAVNCISRCVLKPGLLMFVPSEGIKLLGLFAFELVKR